MVIYTYFKPSEKSRRLKLAPICSCKTIKVLKKKGIPVLLPLKDTGFKCFDTLGS